MHTTTWCTWCMVRHTTHAHNPYGAWACEGRGTGLVGGGHGLRVEERRNVRLCVYDILSGMAKHSVPCWCGWSVRTMHAHILARAEYHNRCATQRHTETSAAMPSECLI